MDLNIEYIAPQGADDQERREMMQDMADVEGCPPFSANGLPDYTLLFLRDTYLGSTYREDPDYRAPVPAVKHGDRDGMRVTHHRGRAYTTAGLSAERLEEVKRAGRYAGIDLGAIYRRQGWNLLAEKVWSRRGA